MTSLGPCYMLRCCFAAVEVLHVCCKACRGPQHAFFYESMRTLEERSGGVCCACAQINVTLIALFNYYYTFLQLEPKDMADQLKRAGASIPAVTPICPKTETTCGYCLCCSCSWQRADILAVCHQTQCLYNWRLNHSYCSTFSCTCMVQLPTRICTASRTDCMARHGCAASLTPACQLM